METGLNKEKACSFPVVVHKIVEYCGTCGMRERERERDEVITEFSSENLKE